MKFKQDNPIPACIIINIEESFKTLASITNYLKVCDLSHLNPRRTSLKWAFYVRVTITFKLCKVLKTFHQPGERMVFVSQTRQYLQKQNNLFTNIQFKKIEIGDVSSFWMDWHSAKRLSYVGSVSLDKHKSLHGYCTCMFHHVPTP